MTETACFHGRLAFDDGGETVVCLDCPKRWPGEEPASDTPRQPPIGLGRRDVRLAPRLLGTAGGGSDQSRAPRVLLVEVKG